MKEQFKNIFSPDVVREVYDLIRYESDEQPPEFLTDEEILKRLSGIKLSLAGYKKIVQQNKNLQSELSEIKKRPFFPYVLNSGNHADFGEFYLISHAWFTISNLPCQLGIVEIECKPEGTRKMYLGYGESCGKDFRKDVVNVVLFGQKIKDSGEV